MARFDMSVYHLAFDLKKDHQEDQDNIMNYFDSIDVKEYMAHEAQPQQTETLNKLMSILQNLMGLMSITDPVHKRIAAVLYRIFKQSGLPLPDQALDHGEVQICGSSYYPPEIRGMYVRDGLFLGKEKVICKSAFIGHQMSMMTPAHLDRFEQETKVLQAVYQKDQGKYTVPIYGVVMAHLRPMWVVPWQCDEGANEMVKEIPNFDYKRFIKETAKAIEVLHTMEPPIAHGDIRGRHILLSDVNTPLLTDFGMAKFLWDIDDNQQISHLARGRSYLQWRPDGLSYKGDHATLALDIYAFGITILEFLTGRMPWDAKNSRNVPILMYNGDDHYQPDDEQTIKRGLNNGLWALLLKCWHKDPTRRPSIQDVIKELDTIWPEVPEVPL